MPVLSMTEKKIIDRNQSIDLIKIIAMFGVIALHVFIEYIDLRIVQWQIIMRPYYPFLFFLW